jgi:hypothetical protein
MKNMRCSEIKYLFQSEEINFINWDLNSHVTFLQYQSSFYWMVFLLELVLSKSHPAALRCQLKCFFLQRAPECIFESLIRHLTHAFTNHLFIHRSWSACVSDTVLGSRARSEAVSVFREISALFFPVNWSTFVLWLVQSVCVNWLMYLGIGTLSLHTSCMCFWSHRHCTSKGELFFALSVILSKWLICLDSSVSTCKTKQYHLQHWRLQVKLNERK